MKLNDLRLGNYVSINTGIIKMDLLMFVTFTHHFEKYVPQPIPLTEEILLKCGFVKTENDIFVLNDFWFINGNLSMNRPDIKRTKRLGRPLKYFIHAFIKSDINSLHQLQNLYFSLTGEELICKLK